MNESRLQRLVAEDASKEHEKVYLCYSILLSHCLQQLLISKHETLSLREELAELVSGYFIICEHICKASRHENALLKNKQLTSDLETSVEFQNRSVELEVFIFFYCFLS